MTNVGGALPGGGDGILHGFEFLNIWMVRHEKGVSVRNGLLNRCVYTVSPSQRWWECWEIRWEIFCPYSPYWSSKCFDDHDYVEKNALMIISQTTLRRWSKISIFFDILSLGPKIDCSQQIVRASWRREGYWIPPETCNSSRLHSHYWVMRLSDRLSDRLCL